MSLRALGALLILSASADAAFGAVREARGQLHLAESLADALDELAACIRFRRLLLPDALQQVGKTARCGKSFLDIADYLESNITLQNAWKRSFSEIQAQEIREILLSVTLDGDEERLLGNLIHGRDRLRTLADEMRRQEALRSRLLWTVSLSGGAILTILLL